MDPLVIALAAAAALVAVGFIAWQAAVGAGVIAVYRERAADASPPLAVFVDAADAARPRLLVRNRGDRAALRVVAWERRALAHEPTPLASFERIEGGAAASQTLVVVPTAPACHVECTHDQPGAVRRQADVPFIVMVGAGA